MAKQQLDIKPYLHNLIVGKYIMQANNKNDIVFQATQRIKMIKALLQDTTFSECEQLEIIIDKLGLKQSFINNRRYLGNKYTLSNFIRKTVEENCTDINIVADVFSGTGAVANAFKDKTLLTNDLLYSNYLSNYAWFANEDYEAEKIIQFIYMYNAIETNENNYMRQNFADTFFAADVCSKIGYIREDIECRYENKELNFKEYAILITSLLYAMDRIANTVGHYDAYRKNAELKSDFKLNVLLPEKNLNQANKCFNEDATSLVKNINCDLLYLDPPYNSRQYCDAYHLLENVARWNKPEVFGVARKMDRSTLKSDYCTVKATEALAKLVKNTNAKYILLSYNNMSNKGNSRSNAKIADEDILKILKAKGKVTIFEKAYKSFSTGKSDINDNKERLFLCQCSKKNISKQVFIPCPFNYVGGKYKLLEQMTKYFYPSNTFFDLFAGGGNVGINANSDTIIFNDKNEKLIGLLQYIRDTKTDELLVKIDKVVQKYDLSNTALYGYDYYDCNSSKGLAEYNREKYLRLRADYNKLLTTNREDYILFYVLIVFAFNNQIRFNSKGEFNLPVGKRDFNAKMRSKLILFSERMKAKNVQFLHKDFRDISLDKLSKNTFLYCDPPYLITNATYNENHMWTEKDEQDLLYFLDKASEKGFKFALSNVLESKDKQNIVLLNWLKPKNYHCYHLQKSYANSNYQRKHKQSVSVEVLITNYQI